MLGKLMKHEFRATARLILPLYLVVVALAAFTRVTNWILEKNDNGILSLINGLFIFLFVVSLFASVIFAVVMMITRFYKNLMTDQGYLMFTLPANIHELLWSKLFVSVIWFIGTVLVDLLAGFIVTYEAGMATDLFNGFRDLFSQLTSYYAMNGTAFVLEAILAFLVTMLTGCLCFYAPISIGHSFANHKTLLSVVFFFAIQFVLRILNIFGFASLAQSFPESGPAMVPEQLVSLVHSAAWGYIGYELVLGAILYFVTWIMLKRHLNLQ
jgi:hypothetical protein